MEDDYLAWKSKILPEIARYFGITADMAKALRARPHVPLFDYTIAQDLAPDALFHGEHSTTKPRRWESKKPANTEDGYDIIDRASRYGEVTKKFGFDAKNPYYSKILKTETLFKESWDVFSFTPKTVMPAPSVAKNGIVLEKDKIKVERQCYHIEIDIGDSGLRYQTGDHVGTWPQNDPDEVVAFTNALQLSQSELDQPFKLTPHPANPLSSTAKMPFPMPCTVRTALMHYVDLKAHMKQYQMEILAKYASNVKERDNLFELADDRETFLAVIEKGQKNLKQVLLEFPSVKV